ncbi:MAG: hypothetical protein ACOCYN_01615 [Planctomycetota bacterium]
MRWFLALVTILPGLLRSADDVPDPIVLDAARMRAALTPADVGEKHYIDLTTPFAITVIEGAVVGGHAVVIETDGDDYDAPVPGAPVRIAGEQVATFYHADHGIIFGPVAQGLAIDLDVEPGAFALPLTGEPYPLVVTHARNHICSAHDRGVLAWRSRRAWSLPAQGRTRLEIVDADVDGSIGSGDGIAPAGGRVFAPLRPFFGTPRALRRVPGIAAVDPPADTVLVRVRLAPGAGEPAVTLALVGERASAVVGADEPEALLPAGRYTLAYGLLVGRDGPLAGILPPTDGELALTVTAGESVTLTLAPPYTLAGSWQDDFGDLILDHDSLHVVGRSGERYVSLDLIEEPTVALRQGEILLATGQAEYG